MKRVLETIGVSIIGILVGKGIDKFDVGIIKTIFQVFLVELWFIWVGILGGLIYWFVRSEISLHKSVKEKMDLEEIRRKLVKPIEEEYRGRLDEIVKQLTPLIKDKFISLLQKQIDTLSTQTDSILKALDSTSRQFEKYASWIVNLQQGIRELGYKGNLLDIPRGREIKEEGQKRVLSEEARIKAIEDGHVGSSKK